MKKFTMKDVEMIEEMIADGKTVEVEWREPYEKENYVGTVKFVRWDGLVFCDKHCIYTGISKLVEIRERIA